MNNAHVNTTWNAYVDVIIVTIAQNFVGWIDYLVANRVPPISVTLSGDDVSRLATIAKSHELSVFLQRH